MWLKLVDEDGDMVRLRIRARTLAALRAAVAEELGVDEANITKIITSHGTVVQTDAHVQMLNVHEVLTVPDLCKTCVCPCMYVACLFVRLYPPWLAVHF